MPGCNKRWTELHCRTWMWIFPLAILGFSMELDVDRCSPKERFERLFSDWTEPKDMPNDSGSTMLWVTLRESFLSRMRAKRVSETYYANVVKVLDRFTRTRNLWDARVDSIKQLDLQEYVTARSENTWSPPKSKTGPSPLSNVTINNEIQILNSIFKYAGPRMNVRGHRDNLAVIEFPPHFEVLDTNDPMPICVSESQLGSFIDASSEATSPRKSVCEPKLFWTCVLVLDSITALRRGALLSVPRPSDDYLVGRRQIPIPAELMKNRRAEVIPLGRRDDVLELLMSLPSKVGEPFLPWRRPDGTRLSLSHFNASMKKFQVKAGISETLRTKHLRSTAATEILNEQFSTDTARKRLGHKSEDVIRKHYQARMVTAADVQASDFLASRVMDLIGKKNNPETIPIRIG